MFTASSSSLALTLAGRRDWRFFIAMTRERTMKGRQRGPAIQLESSRFPRPSLMVATQRRHRRKIAAAVAARARVALITP